MMEREIYQLCRNLLDFEKKHPMTLEHLQDNLRYAQKNALNFFDTFSCHGVYPIPQHTQRRLLLRKFARQIVIWCKKNDRPIMKTTKFDTYIVEKYKQIYDARKNDANSNTNLKLKLS